MSLIQFENRVGNPIKTGQYLLIPIQASLQFQPPGMRGFFFWKKPSSMIVQYPDGRDEVVEVPDVTRQAQMMLVGFALVFSLAAGLIARIVRK
ncbi:MAG: hypothetical protein ACK2T5_14800 [Anaerolineales bacterium]|jgi:hypothetical protein